MRSRWESDAFADSNGGSNIVSLAETHGMAHSQTLIVTTTDGTTFLHADPNAKPVTYADVIAAVDEYAQRDSLSDRSVAHARAFYFPGADCNTDSESNS